jgi:membrane-associated PAP2 superfamily phosphatase
MVDRMTTLFSIIESPNHPRLDALYQRIGITQIKLASQRKALQALKSISPDWIVAEFFYGFGNNYAGANVSNLDILLAAARKQAPTARTIVLVSKEQAQYVPRLAERFRIHAVLTMPVTEADFEAILRGTQAP